MDTVNITELMKASALAKLEYLYGITDPTLDQLLGMVTVILNDDRKFSNFSRSVARVANTQP